jgi:hypothetical protein
MLRGLDRPGAALVDFAHSERYGARKTVFFPFQLARKPFVLYHGRFEFSRAFLRADRCGVQCGLNCVVQCGLRDAPKLLLHLSFGLFCSGIVAGSCRILPDLVRVVVGVGY